MRVKRRKTMALLAAVSIVCAQSTVSDVGPMSRFSTG